MPPTSNKTVSEAVTVDADEKKRRPDACRSPLKELEAHFRTNLKNGLSPKDAEERLNSREDESLFQAPPPRLWDCIKPVISEPVMWLLLTVCAVALFFDRQALGVLSALLMLLHGVACVYMRFKALRLEAQLQLMDIPLSRVIRKGRLLRVRGDRLVPGDVILLRRGDRIPCDARLITSRRLRVAETTLSGDETQREHLLLDKDAAVIPESISPHHSPENMVYAGSTVKGGAGRALVVAVASHTHLGGLVERVPPAQPLKLPSYLESLKSLLSKVNLILAVAVIPLTALGILTQGGRYDFLDIFLAALSVSALTLTEHAIILGLHHDTCVRRAAAEDADAENAAEIRTPDTIERLCTMDHLILMGAAALHDGKSHPAYIYTCGQSYTLDRDVREPSVTALAEKLSLYTMGQADRVKSGACQSLAGLEETISRVCDWAAPDTEALLLRLERMEAKGEAVELMMRHESPMTLYLTDDLSDITGCDLSRTEEGEAVFMTDDALDAWKAALRQACRDGMRVQIMISKTEQGYCAEGFIASAVGLCRKTKGCIKGMEEAGVCVTAFLRDAIPEDKLALSDAGLAELAPLMDLADREAPVDYRAACAEGVRAFVNCRTEDVLDYMDEIHRAGGCVGVVSVERADMSVLASADIAFTCIPTDLREVLRDGQPMMSGAEGGLPDGDPDSVCASDLCRRDAHVLVRRCNAHGGGVCGVRRARLAAGQLMQGLRMSLRFLLLSQLLRLLMLALPLISGVTCLSAPVLLLSGFLTDALALHAYVRCDLSDESLGDSKASPAQALGTPLRLFKAELILTAASILIPFVIALLSRVLGGSLYGDMSYFCALSLTATQILFFATGHRPKRQRRGFFVLVLMCCVYVGLLSVALASGLHVLWCLLLPLLQPLVFLIGYGILRKCGAISYCP